MGEPWSREEAPRGSLSVSTSSCRCGGRYRGGGGDAEERVAAEGCGEDVSCGGDCLAVCASSPLSAVCPVTIFLFLDAVVMLSKPAVKPARAPGRGSRGSGVCGATRDAADQCRANSVQPSSFCTGEWQVYYVYGWGRYNGLEMSVRR